MFDSLFTDMYFSVEHLVLDAGNVNQEGYATDLSLINVPGNIQPSTPEMTALYGGAYGKVHTLYTSTSGVLEGDRLTVSGTGQKFIVKGKQDYEYEPMQYAQYVLEEVL